MSLSRPTDLVSVKSVIQSIETSQTITDIPTASIDSRLNQSETDSKLQLELQSEDVSLTEVSQLTHSTIESSAITTSAMTTKPTTASQARVQHFFDFLKTRFFDKIKDFQKKSKKPSSLTGSLRREQS